MMRLTAVVLVAENIPPTDRENILYVWLKNLSCCMSRVTAAENTFPWNPLTSFFCRWWECWKLRTWQKGALFWVGGGSVFSGCNYTTTHYYCTGFSGSRFRCPSTSTIHITTTNNRLVDLESIEYRVMIFCLNSSIKLTSSRITTRIRVLANRWQAVVYLYSNQQKTCKMAFF